MGQTPDPHLLHAPPFHAYNPIPSLLGLAPPYPHSWAPLARTALNEEVQRLRAEVAAKDQALMSSSSNQQEVITQMQAQFKALSVEAAGAAQVCQEMFFQGFLPRPATGDATPPPPSSRSASAAMHAHRTSRLPYRQGLDYLPLLTAGCDSGDSDAHPMLMLGVHRNALATPFLFKITNPTSPFPPPSHCREPRASRLPAPSPIGCAGLHHPV
eukprot:365091-Chlamydomonas_euryale.AAC.7